MVAYRLDRCLSLLEQCWDGQLAARSSLLLGIHQHAWKHGFHFEFSNGVNESHSYCLDQRHTFFSLRDNINNNGLMMIIIVVPIFYIKQVDFIMRGMTWNHSK